MKIPQGEVSASTPCVGEESALFFPGTLEPTLYKNMIKIVYLLENEMGPKTPNKMEASL